MQTSEFRKKLQGIITANDFVYKKHKPYLPFHENEFLLKESALHPGHHTITIPEYGIVATFDKDNFNGKARISTFHDTNLTEQDIIFWQHIIMLYFLKYAQHEIPWLRTFCEKVDSNPVY